MRPDFPVYTFWLSLVFFKDERGFFSGKAYNRDAVQTNSVSTGEFVQDNHAYSTGCPACFGGFIFRLPPAAQAKLVWVTRGAVLDVVVDLRKGSPDFRQVALSCHPESAANFKRMFIPRGFRACLCDH